MRDSPSTMGCSDATREALSVKQSTPKLRPVAVLGMFLAFTTLPQLVIAKPATTVKNPTAWAVT